MVSKRQQDMAVMSANRAQTVLKQADDDLTPDGSEAVSIEKAPEDDAAEEQEIVAACMQGASEAEVKIFGHRVKMKLLSIKEEIQAASLAKASQGTSAYTFARSTAYFALSCQSIDGIPFYVSIAADGSEAPARWKIALDYYRPFVDAFFKQYTELRKQEEEKLDRLEK